MLTSPSQNSHDQVDESHIPEYHIHHTGAATADVSESHRYPFAGKANAKLRLGVVAVDGAKGAVTWMDIGSEQDMYLARVDWLVDGSLTAQVGGVVLMNPEDGDTPVELAE